MGMATDTGNTFKDLRACDFFFQRASA